MRDTTQNSRRKFILIKANKPKWVIWDDTQQFRAPPKNAINYDIWNIISQTAAKFIQLTDNDKYMIINMKHTHARTVCSENYTPARQFILS